MSRNKVSLALLVASLAATPLLARAEGEKVDDAAVLAARDAVDPGNCSIRPADGSGFAIKRFELPHTTLIEVPCRTTVNSVMSIFFSQDDGVLHPIPFAAAAIDYRHDEHDRIDWSKAHISGFVGVQELPDAYVDQKAGKIYSAIRLPAGEADGTITSVYRLDDELLARVDIDITGKKASVRSFAWPAAKP